MNFVLLWLSPLASLTKLKTYRLKPNIVENDTRCTMYHLEHCIFLGITLVDFCIRLSICVLCKTARITYSYHHYSYIFECDAFSGASFHSFNHLPDTSQDEREMRDSRKVKKKRERDSYSRVYSRLWSSSSFVCLFFPLYYSLTPRRVTCMFSRRLSLSLRISMFLSFFLYGLTLMTSYTVTTSVHFSSTFKKNNICSHNFTLKPVSFHFSALDSTKHLSSRAIDSQLYHLDDAWDIPTNHQCYVYVCLHEWRVRCCLTRARSIFFDGGWHPGWVSLGWVVCM